MLSVYILNCSPLPTIGAHQNRSQPLARWAVACRWTPVQARCSLPSRPRAKCRATTTCIAEVAPPRLGGFADVESEAEFVAVLKAGVAAKKIPEPLLDGFLDFYNNYKSKLLPFDAHHILMEGHDIYWIASWGNSRLLFSL